MTDLPFTDQSAIDWKHLYDVLAKRFSRLDTEMNTLSENTRRNTEEAIFSTRKDLLLQFLAIGDDINRCAEVAASGQNISTLQEGLSMLQRKFDELLKRNEVSEISGSTGMPFDPRQHEAEYVERSATIAADMVISVLRKGYQIGPKLLRPVHVSVSSGPPAASQ